MFRLIAILLCCSVISANLPAASYERVLGHRRIDLPNGRFFWVLFLEKDGHQGFSVNEPHGVIRPAEALARIPDPLDYGYVSLGSFDILSARDIAALGRFTNLKGLKLARSTLQDGAIKELGNLTALTSLDLSDAKIIGGNLESLERLKNLRVLDLSRSNINDAAMPHIAALVGLAELRLTRTTVSDKGAGQLAALRNLTTLTLGATAVTDAGARQLAKLTKLQTLELAYTRITGSTGPVLGKLSEVQDLDLSHTQVDSVAMKDVAALRKLRVLNVDGTKVDDEGLAHLASHPSLAKISLDNTSAGNEGLKILARLPQLESLSARGTRITRAGWAPLFDIPKLVAIQVDDVLPTAALESQMFQLTQTAAAPLLASPDGKWGFRRAGKKGGIAGVPYTIAEVFDIASGKQVGNKLIHPFPIDEITCHAFSPDGKYVALGAGHAPYPGINSGNFSVWEIGSGELVYFYRGAETVGKGRKTDPRIGVVRKIAFAPDSRHIYFVADKYEHEGP